MVARHLRRGGSLTADYHFTTALIPGSPAW